MANKNRQPYFWEKQPNLVQSWRNKSLRNLSKGCHLFVYLLNLIIVAFMIKTFVSHDHLKQIDLGEKQLVGAYTKLFSLPLFFIPVIGLKFGTQQDGEKGSSEKRGLLLFLGFGSMMSLLSCSDMYYVLGKTWPFILGICSTSVYFYIWAINCKYLFGSESVPCDAPEQ
jgi:hypothetical protein